MSGLLGVLVLCAMSLGAPLAAWMSERMTPDDLTPPEDRSEQP